MADFLGRSLTVVQFQFDVVKLSEDGGYDSAGQHREGKVERGFEMEIGQSHWT